MKVLRCVGLALLVSSPAFAQQHEHAMTMAPKPAPTAGGQAAFATLSEIVKLLKADATTDWSKVNLEALRQHLIDMDDVILRSTVVKRNVAGGLQMDITGTGRTAVAIKRMVTAHAHVLDEHTPYKPVARDIPGGMRLTVTAKDTASAATVAMIRGLGFAGIMVEGDHHAQHHLMMARGTGHH